VVEPVGAVLTAFVLLPFMSPAVLGTKARILRFFKSGMRAPG